MVVRASALRVVDQLLADLDARVGLSGEGPDGRTYVDLPDRTGPASWTTYGCCPSSTRSCAATSRPGGIRSPRREHLGRLWTGANGIVLPPLLVDGRITGYWRATGSARRRPLEVVWFAGTRRPRKAELDAPVGRARGGARPSPSPT